MTEEATLFSNVDAFETEFVSERSFLDAVLITTDGAVALDRMSFGRCIDVFLEDDAFGVCDRDGRAIAEVELLAIRLLTLAELEWPRYQSSHTMYIYVCRR